MTDDFYKNEYFKQLDARLDTLEKKIDNISSKVTWIYAWSAGAGACAAFLITYLKKIL